MVKRDLTAIKDAGLKQIDYLLVTHFHADHFGAVPTLAKEVRGLNVLVLTAKPAPGGGAASRWCDSSPLRAEGFEGRIVQYRQYAQRVCEAVPAPEIDYCTVTHIGLVHTTCPGSVDPSACGNPCCSPRT